MSEKNIIDYQKPLQKEQNVLQRKLRENDEINFLKLNHKAITIFGDTLILLTGYFLFETFKIILIGRDADKAPMSNWILTSLGITVITVLVVLYITNAYPDTEISAQPLPPSSLREIEEDNDHKNTVL
jgi:hypothetical protein